MPNANVPAVVGPRRTPRRPPARGLAGPEAPTLYRKEERNGPPGRRPRGVVHARLNARAPSARVSTDSRAVQERVYVADGRGAVWALDRRRGALVHTVAVGRGAVGLALSGPG
jgi:hypothetical protein